jgi:exodeoxyribonuclease VII large subunit
MTEAPLLAANNLQPYSVGELSQALKRTVESAFGLVRVRGEIAQPKLAATGHLYLSLKDADAVLDAVAWRGTVSKLGIKPEHGMDVICTGRLTTYAKNSRYQLVIETMELAGEGALLKLLEDRKRRLAAEGLFDPSRKQLLPHIPESIGVITSPSGAVIHDILHRLADRFPRHVMVWPVAVQGAGAAEQIAAAINGFNELEAEGDVPRPAVLIVARGGGSLEDLMPFNEEIVVRAIAASHIPVISAVGHETDHTLCDLVADLRAPTPTAAAEFAVPVRAELASRLREADRRLDQGIAQILENRRVFLQTLARGLSHPRRLIETASQTLDDRSERLHQVVIAYLRGKKLHLDRAGAGLKHPRTALAESRQALMHLQTRAVSAISNRRQHSATMFAALSPRLSPAPLQRKTARDRERFEAFGRHLESLSYKRTLERGFVVVRGPDGHPITQAAKVKPGQDVVIEFSDKTAKAKIQ